MSNAPNTTHLAHARSGNIPGLWQARCCCGWLGEILSDEGNANAEAGTHMRHERILNLVEAYAPNATAEPLDEQRRRNV